MGKSQDPLGFCLPQWMSIRVPCCAYFRSYPDFLISSVSYAHWDRSFQRETLLPLLPLPLLSADPLSWKKHQNPSR